MDDSSRQLSTTFLLLLLGAAALAGAEYFIPGPEEAAPSAEVHL